MTGCHVCDKPLPPIAVAHLDVFCSRACACVAHGVTFDPTRTSSRVGYAVERGAGTEQRMRAGSQGEPTALQRARARASELARERVAAEQQDERRRRDRYGPRVRV